MGAEAEADRPRARERSRRVRKVPAPSRSNTPTGSLSGAVAHFSVLALQSWYNRRWRCQVNLSRSEKPEAGYATTLPPLHSAIRSSLRPERSEALIARRDGVRG